MQRIFFRVIIIIFKTFWKLLIDTEESKNEFMWKKKKRNLTSNYFSDLCRKNHSLNPSSNIFVRIRCWQFTKYTMVICKSQLSRKITWGFHITIIIIIVSLVLLIRFFFGDFWGKFLILERKIGEDKEHMVMSLFLALFSNDLHTHTQLTPWAKPAIKNKEFTQWNF